MVYWKKMAGSVQLQPVGLKPWAPDNHSQMGTLA